MKVVLLLLLLVCTSCLTEAGLAMHVKAFFIFRVFALTQATQSQAVTQVLRVSL